MKFKIYSKYGCPYCVKIENVFQLMKLEYEIYKLDEDFNRTDFMHEFGPHAAFPQIVLNDKHKLGGCIDTINFLKQNKLIG